MDIDARTRRSLEWSRLKDYLASESNSAASRQLCLNLEIHTQLAIVQLLVDETDEALAMESSGFSLSQIGLPDLSEVINRLRATAQLSAAELMSVRQTLVLARRARTTLSGLSRDEFPRLSRFAPDIHSLDNVVREIDNVFDESGSVRDDASSTLRQLKREVSRLNNQVKDELIRIINSPTYSKALQEPIYTLRNGRYVVPVQVALRSSIEGIVHDSSASGLTIYVEPMNVVELTNKVRIKEGEIEREIDRLLSELSALVSEHTDDIDTTYKTLVELDFIAARARLAQRYKGTKPEVRNDQTVLLRDAKHPLLVLQSKDASTVIPNDIVFDGKVRTLIITGPNTGGKTVYLKTAGLAALMVRGGLLLPCSAGSQMGIFTEVLADIGDEQSLEQSLSTFSSHMTNIVEIVKRARRGVLVLLDEVGAGTDPREGAILARVILQHLNNCGATTISTTHYGDLKSLAYTTDGFMNASLDFDEVNLIPTYRLRPGIPGSSKAVTIASRLGLPNELVAEAERALSEEQTDVQAAIEEIETRLQAAAKVEDEANAKLAAAQTLQASLEEQRSRWQQDESQRKAAFKKRMDDEIDAASQIVKGMIADLQRQPDMAKAQRAQKELEVLRQELGWTEESPAQTKQIQVGQRVRVRSLNQKGVVESVPEDGEDPAAASISVRVGTMKVKVAAKDLEPLQEQQPAKPHVQKPAKRQQYKQPTREVASSSGDNQLDVFVRTQRNTLDLRGQRVEEAMGNLESFVDTCFLEQISPFMIIHGHGTGAVRSAVRGYLKDCPYKVKFRPGENYEGGDGVTVVQLS